MEVNINAKHQVSQKHAISNSGGESEGLVKDLCAVDHCPEKGQTR